MSVAVTVSPTDSQVAIVASDSGGLFRTTDGGTTWQHIDAFAPFRVNDVAFAAPSSSIGQVVLATTVRDAQTDSNANYGGIWRSVDSGLSWSHVAPPTSCTLPQSAFEIAYLGPNDVFVAADCGVLSSSDLGATWTMLPSTVRARSVVARPSPTGTLLDVCLFGLGHRRSTDGGATWSPIHSGPICTTPHSVAASPLERDVLFAIAQGHHLIESDDGGQTWPIDLQATAYNERPVWVKTRPAADQDPSHFDLYFPGRRVTCSNTVPRCPSNNPGERWARVPDSNLNHDINGLAFDPQGSCPVLMVGDYGVYRRGDPSANAPCGADSAWTHVGRASTGLGSLQIYDVTGQLHDPAYGQGAPGNGTTNLFIGTQDNLFWANQNAGESGWQGFGSEGSYLQTVYQAPIAPDAQLRLTYVEFGGKGQAMKVEPDTQAGTWSAPSPWTAADPPGNATAPVLISPNTYVQWSSGSLLRTKDGGSSWSTVSTLPADPVDPSDALMVPRFGPGQVRQVGGSEVTQTSSGPALYEYVRDTAGRTGLVFVPQVLAGVPQTTEIRTFDGRNGKGVSSGLGGIASNCFGDGAWYCHAVYAADPNDSQNLIAADPKQKAILGSNDGGNSWHDVGLTGLVTAGGTLSFTDALGGSQAHVIAYDPWNSNRILVGTDQAGLIASADGGRTWTALPDTNRATAISSIFFDDRTGAIYVATYGRGLWKLTVNWAALNGGNAKPIPQADSTAPAVQLFVGFRNTEVNATAGNTVQLTLPASTGTVNLTALARDPQSGIHNLSIYVGTTTTTCSPNCSGGPPGLPGKPSFEKEQPAKSPGQTITDDQLQLQGSLSLASEIPQGPLGPGIASRTTVIEVTAQADNNVGGRAHAAAKLTFTQP